MEPNGMTPEINRQGAKSPRGCGSFVGGGNKPEVQTSGHTLGIIGILSLFADTCAHLNASAFASGSESESKENRIAGDSDSAADSGLGQISSRPCRSSRVRRNTLQSMGVWEPELRLWFGSQRQRQYQDDPDHIVTPDFWLLFAWPINSRLYEARKTDLCS